MSREIKKYEQIPNIQDGNYALISMHGLSGIKYYLQNFPKSNNKAGHIGSKTVSATLIWSGIEANNVVVETFDNRPLGFMINPNEILMPHGEFLAYRTGSIVPEEVKKDGFVGDNGFSSTNSSSKYPSKMGRRAHGMGQSIFTTNHARWERMPGSDIGDNKSGVYRDEGTADIFAKNVWRRRFKKGKSMASASKPLNMNEALVLQKRESSPISGIVVRQDMFGKVSQAEKGELQKLLKDNPRLKLYVYDLKLKEHIIREVDNNEAQKLIISPSIDSKNLPAFKGFNINQEKQPSEKTVGSFVLSYFKKGGQDGLLARSLKLNLAQKKKLLYFVWGGNVLMNKIYKDYDLLKESCFVGSKDTNFNGSFSKLEIAQIFNDIFRDNVAQEIMKEDKVFAKKYYKLHQELGLDKFLNKEQYENAKARMLEFINNPKLVDLDGENKAKPGKEKYQPKPPANPKNIESISLKAKHTQANISSSSSIGGVIEVQKVAAYGDSKLNADENNAGLATVNCSKRILKAFQAIIARNPRLLNASYQNPYTNESKRFPANANHFTAKHLHILARNEEVNVTGKMNVGLYNDLLSSHDVAAIRCLVKATTVSGVAIAHKTGSFGGQALRPAAKTIIIDQSGLQWQDDLRNTGGMFFYPVDYATLDSKYKKWQEDMYEVLYSAKRPDAHSVNNHKKVNWNGVPGYIDLGQVTMAIEFEFMRALEAANSQANLELDVSNKVNFKYLKAGMGFFSSGINISSDLEIARLNGIKNALGNLSGMSASDKRIYLERIDMMELPYSDNNNPGIKDLLSEIESLVGKVGLQWGGADEKDAFAKVDGYVSATTNCGDPHAMIGNEGKYGSVDATLACNANLDHLNAAANLIIQVRQAPEYSANKGALQVNSPVSGYNVPINSPAVGSGFNAVKSLKDINSRSVYLDKMGGVGDRNEFNVRNGVSTTIGMCFAHLYQSSDINLSDRNSRPFIELCKEGLMIDFRLEEVGVAGEIQEALKAEQIVQQELCSQRESHPIRIIVPLIKVEVFLKLLECKGGFKLPASQATNDLFRAKGIVKPDQENLQNSGAVR